jgi:hypothetical protein
MNNLSIVNILSKERKRSSNLEKNFKWVKRSLLNNVDSIPESTLRKRRFQLKVLLICIPCGGFGDIIFCMKIKNYLSQWFACETKIATTSPNKFIGLGEKEEDLYSIESTTGDIDCVEFRDIKNFHNFSAYQDFVPIEMNFDLIFITPRFTVANQDMFADIKNLQNFIPYANMFNTYFFSEYDTPNIFDYEKNFDFLTGLGKKCLGILLTGCYAQFFERIITEPYCFVYIAELSDRADVEQSSYKCYIDFFKLIFQKYKVMYDEFTVVIPQWIFNDFLDMDYTSEVWNLIRWKTIVFKDRKNTFQVENSNPNSVGTLTLDATRFPCPNELMMNLIHYSEEDILVTGDQSITDVISCSLESNRGSKKIWYQRVPWKLDFIDNFSASSCSDDALKSDETSCGILQMQNSCDLKKVKDFRVQGKEKLEKVMELACKVDMFELNKLNRAIEEVEKDRKNIIDCDDEFLYILRNS